MTTATTTTQPLTAADYFALREYLDRWACYRLAGCEAHWPLVVGEGEHTIAGLDEARRGSAAPPAIAARAAWWLAFTAPRREAEAQGTLADQSLEHSNAAICGYVWFGDFWHHQSTRPGDGVPGLTTRQLRARLAFNGATGVVCERCHGEGGWYEGGYADHEPPEPVRCPECAGEGRVYPEADQQREPVHGDGYIPGLHDYDGGDKPPAYWMCPPGAFPTPADVAAELAYRAAQPDVFFAGPHGERRVEVPATLVSTRLGVLVGGGLCVCGRFNPRQIDLFDIAREPLLALIHGNGAQGAP